MILVVSQENDVSTDNFIEWCNYRDKPVIRINENESINLVEQIVLNNGCDISLTMKGQKISLSQIESVWFRRGAVYHTSGAEHLSFENLTDTDSIKSYFANESKTISEFIIYMLKEKRSLNHPGHYNSNKLIVLKTAQEVGLNIPKTLITRQLTDVKKHFGEEQVLTKSIQDAVTVEYDNYKFSPYVHMGKFEDLNLPAHFYYSKFQSLIEIKYELRIFFVADQYYTSAKFARAKTADQGRIIVPREIPYILPDKIIEKLKKLNAALEFNSGSIDMLVDKNGTYYFLEINPVGQYDAMSVLCNFYLDTKILNYLTNEEPV